MIEKVMQSPFFMKKPEITALPGKMGNHGFFYKILVGENGFWTKINVQFGKPNHFLCFDIFMEGREPCLKNVPKTSGFGPVYELVRRIITGWFSTILHYIPLLEKGWPIGHKKVPTNHS
jgi:hypothetical protein